ncbi:uncharacterized protein LOC114194289 [Vigna unguiculata]|uniref:uncharacterized protein LOC114194289 n=1 Tax=Vigna unguiculata TaxID=3917 RepID=UPI001017147D|nr:uncharacterized protein LOC114194289 [Vigna unguiculata]
MTKSQVKPANILLTLKEKDECNVTTLKQVYNARYRYKRSIRGSRTELQQLMLMLERDHYIHFSRCLDESDVVSDLFWTHPDDVKLLNSFNIVFLMDNTYKTNKYWLPLLEIVGVTSTGLTFSAAFAFLSSEKQNNFIWALERLRGKVHNVSKCVDAWDVVLQAWENVMDCEDELKFNDCVNRLELVCQSWPVFFEYVNDSWIIPYKKFFVKAWTNKVIHFGNTTSNIVESAHWSLKKVLRSSMGDLCSCWDGIHNVIILQHNEIKASFERSINLISDSYKALSYRRLVGSISRCALELLAPELERVKKIGFDTSHCGCILRQTYGLPCACELARYDPGMIPLQEIHVMWTRCIAALLGMGEESWPLIRHDLYKELSQWRDEYATLVGGYDRLEELRKSLLVRLQEGCPLPTVDIISSSNCYPKAKGWASFYRDRMQAFLDLHVVDRSYVDLMED